MKNIDRKNLNNFVTRICMCIMVVGLLIAAAIDEGNANHWAGGYILWLLVWFGLLIYDKVHLDEDERK